MGEGEAISVGGGVGGGLEGAVGRWIVAGGGGVNNYGYETWRGGKTWQGLLVLGDCFWSQPNQAMTRC